MVTAVVSAIVHAPSILATAIAVAPVSEIVKAWVEAQVTVSAAPTVPVISRIKAWLLTVLRVTRVPVAPLLKVTEVPSSAAAA